MYQLEGKGIERQMLTLFLCDDCPRMIAKYSAWINQCADKHRVPITLSTFDSGEALMFLLSDAPNQADIIYLDILMGEMNGMETAKQLRRLGCRSEIIFLTTSEDYVFDAFDISPVQYLIKDATSEERFEEIFLRAVSLCKNRRTEMFVCETAGVRKIIPMKDISYFEIWKRLVQVHYQEDKSFEYYGTLEQLEQQLMNKDFIRVHRSFIVNMRYIRNFQRPNLILKTGEAIPIGVTYAKRVELAFSDYMFRLNIHK